MWSLLESNLVNTNPYNHITAYKARRDGKRAWKALSSFHEGENFIQKTQDEAMSILSSTYYKGEARNFGFEDYINKYLNAHKKLSEVGYNNGLGMD